MKSNKIGAFEAKTHLAAILDRVERGATYIITKRGRPVAELRPAASERGLRFGMDDGRIAIRDDFDAPLDDFDQYLK